MSPWSRLEAEETIVTHFSIWVPHQMIFARKKNSKELTMV